MMDKLLAMAKVLALSALIFVTSFSIALAPTRFRPRESGNWGTATTWEQWDANAGRWVTATNAPGANDDVIIDGGFTVGVKKKRKVRSVQVGGSTPTDPGRSVTGTLRSADYEQGKPKNHVKINATDSITITEGGSVIGDGTGCVALTARNTISNSGVITGRRVLEQGGRIHEPGRATATGGWATKQAKSFVLGPMTGVSGWGVAIVGGPNSLLDLSDSGSHVISATERIWIATGPGGVVDLTGIPIGTNVLVAGTDIYLNADNVLLDPGVFPADITEPDAIVGTGLLYAEALVLADGDQVAQPGETVEVGFTVYNTGNTTDTYHLMASDSQGWSLNPSSVDVELGMATDAHVTIDVSVPHGGVGITDVITMTDIAHPDPTWGTNLDSLEVQVIPFYIYLPIIIKNP